MNFAPSDQLHCKSIVSLFIGFVLATWSSTEVIAMTFFGALCNVLSVFFVPGMCFFDTPKFYVSHSEVIHCHFEWEMSSKPVVLSEMENTE